MAFDESFRPRHYIDEHEAFELTGKPRKYREIVPNHFDGPIAEWADYRTVEFKELIVPVMTFPEQVGGEVHRVSWVFHSGYDAEAETDFSQYHIACDCFLMAEIAGETDSVLECSVLQKTINRRAAFWREELKLDKVLRACADSEEGRNKITLDRRFFATETIMWLLTNDYEHPESWFGNITSGEHSVSLLALVLQESPDSVRMLVEDLAEDGRLEYDGQETVLLAA